MRLAFFGTPAIAVPSLEALVCSHHDVACVVTRPDKPAGRSRALRPPAVVRTARAAGIEVFQPAKAGDCVADLHRLGLDVVVVVAYGGWLPPPVLRVAPHGCVNLHPSLLPRWRGAAPIERAIMAGDTTTGVATMAIDEGLDTGPVYLVVEVPIGADDNALSLSERLGDKGADLVLATLDGIERGSLSAVAQPPDGVTYAEKLRADECRIDWASSTSTTDGLIRGANPRPGAWTEIDGRRIKVWSARPVDQPEVPAARDAGAAPGTVVSTDPLVVATGDGALEVLSVQPDGRSPMSAADYARGHRLELGRVQFA